MDLLHRRDSIVLTAIEIMSELGIQGLTTKEIAQRQEISEGTIFRHFKNKNEIILAMLDQFSQYDKDIMNSLRVRDMGFKDSVRYFITSYAEYYNNYPDIVSLAYSYDVFINEAQLADFINKIFKERFQFLIYLVERGKERDEISQNIDSESLADIIQGVFHGVSYRWRITGYSFPLKDRMLQTIDMILDNLEFEK